MKSRILLISSAQTPDTVEMNDKFAARLSEQLDSQLVVTRVHYDALACLFDDGLAKAFLLPSGENLAEYDLLYFKSYNSASEHAVALAECLRIAGVPFVGDELQEYMSSSKLTEYARMVRFGLPIPRTLFIPRAQLADSYELLVRELKSPFILKDMTADKGNLNFLVRSAEQLQEIVGAHGATDFVAQTFIPNDGDLRVLVLGGKISLVIERRRHDDTTHLNNTSQGATAELLPLETFDPAIARIAIEAATVLRREIAGVDIMIEKDTGRPFVLEVNACPQIASGAFLDEKTHVVAEYLQRKLAAKRKDAR